MRVCLCVPCGHLLGKGWPLVSRVWCITVSLSFSHWYPGSGVVLDCIDSWSLHTYLLKCLFFVIIYPCISVAGLKQYLTNTFSVIRSQWTVQRHLNVTMTFPGKTCLRRDRHLKSVTFWKRPEPLNFIFKTCRRLNKNPTWTRFCNVLFSVQDVLVTPYLRRNIAHL